MQFALFRKNCENSQMINGSILWLLPQGNNWKLLFKERITMEEDKRSSKAKRRKTKDRRESSNVNYELMNFSKPDSRTESERRSGKEDRRKDQQKVTLLYIR